MRDQRSTIEEIIRSIVRDEIEFSVVPHLEKLNVPKYWVSLSEAAAMLSVSEAQISRWVDQGELDRMHRKKSGRRVLVSVESIRRFGMAAPADPDEL